MARLAATPHQVQRLLEVLVPFGFTPSRVELAQNGSIVLHTVRAEEGSEPDLLAQWEATRARQVN